MRKLPALAVTLSLFAACSGPTVKDGALVVIDKSNTTQHNNAALFPDMVESWHFVKLENSEQALLNEICKVKIDGDMVFIYSSPGLISGDTKQEIKVFDRHTGRFLHNIGVFGRGPQEYYNISAWSINPNDKSVAIVCYGREMVKYGYDGRFIERREVKMPGMANSIEYLPDGDILARTYMNPRSTASIYLLDGDFNTKDSIAFTPFRLTSEYGYSGVSYSSSSTTSIHNGNVLVLKDMCDTVFSYNEGKLAPAYYTTIYRGIPASMKFRESYDMNKFMDELTSQGYDRMNAISIIMETDRYAILSGYVNSVIWDKKLGRGVAMAYSGKKAFLPSGNVAYADGNTLVSKVEPLQLLDFKEKYLAEGNALTPEQEALFDGLTESDNSVLIFYELKKDIGSFK